MTIIINGAIGGSPDGNPEHGSACPIKDATFDNIEDAINFIRNCFIASGWTPQNDTNMHGGLEISWIDQEK